MILRSQFDSTLRNHVLRCSCVSDEVADHTQIMHGEKRKVETYEHQGEDEFSDFLTQELPGYLRNQK